MPKPSAKSKSSPASASKKRPVAERESSPSKSVKAAQRPQADAAQAKAVKIGKRLEAVAREIKDADEFVEHVAGLAKRYRREQALRAGDAQAELRQSLRLFQSTRRADRVAAAREQRQGHGHRAQSVRRVGHQAVRLPGPRPAAEHSNAGVANAGRQGRRRNVAEMKQGGAETHAEDRGRRPARHVRTSQTEACAPAATRNPATPFACCAQSREKPEKQLSRPLRKQH